MIAEQRVTGVLRRDTSGAAFQSQNDMSELRDAPEGWPSHA
jgi:hypothetical protein